MDRAFEQLIDWAATMYAFEALNPELAAGITDEGRAPARRSACMLGPACRAGGISRQSMNEPKRHHWWPELQQRYWLNETGTVHACRADGSFFPASPSNTAVERNLYTLYRQDGSRNLQIEAWFSSSIEGPFAQTLAELVSIHIDREPFFGDARQAEMARQLGFVVNPYREFVFLKPAFRRSLADYLAALLVRSPRYIAKLEQFHARQNADHPTSKRDLSLANMLSVYEIYRDAVRRASLMVVLADGAQEFLYADSGISAQEPWGREYLPFTIHAPLTPKLAIEVLPLRGERQRSKCFVGRASDVATERMNRIALSTADRFVFSRAPPPTAFIRKHFGKAPPNSIGHRWINGQLETMYDKTRDD